MGSIRKGSQGAIGSTGVNADNDYMPRKVVTTILFALLLAPAMGAVGLAGPSVDVSLTVEGSQSPGGAPPGDPPGHPGGPGGGGGPLPNTGSDVASLLLAAISLIAIGKILGSTRSGAEGASEKGSRTCLA